MGEVVVDVDQEQLPHIFVSARMWQSGSDVFAVESPVISCHALSSDRHSPHANFSTKVAGGI